MIGLLKLIPELLPVVGNVIDNIKSSDGGEGKVFTPKLIKSLVRLVGLIAITYLIATGKADVSDLDLVKKF